MQIFRIRSKATGLYSKGGSTPRFSKKGKVWTGRGPLSLHFTQLSDYGAEIYKREDCEVVAYELSEVETGTSSIQDEIKAAEIRENVRKQEEEELRYSMRIRQLIAERDKLLRSK